MCWLVRSPVKQPVYRPHFERGMATAGSDDGSRGHARHQGNSLFPSEEGGRFDRYNGRWCGYREYEKEGLGRIRD